jgi:hypothetical protein
MPILVTEVTAEVLPNYLGELYFFTNLSGEVQFEDYINLNGFIAYLQNLTQVETLTYLPKPMNFGLKNRYNVPTYTLEISY